MVWLVTSELMDGARRLHEGIGFQRDAEVRRYDYRYWSYFLTLGTGMPARDHDLLRLPSDLPEPIDDGACDHLLGMRIPDVALRSASDRELKLSALVGWTIVYSYPVMHPVFPPDRNAEDVVRWLRTQGLPLGSCNAPAHGGHRGAGGSEPGELTSKEAAR